MRLPFLSKKEPANLGARFISIGSLLACVVFATVPEAALAQTQTQSTAATSLQSGITLYQKKDYQGAARLLRASNTEQQTATATYYVALCYEQLHYHDQAVDMFKRICTFWPASDEAAMATAYLKKLAEQTAAAPAGGKDTLAEDVKKSEQITRAEWQALPNKTRVLIAREHGHLMVTAKVNGQWGKFVFDTGASCCGIGLLDYPNMFTPAQLANAKRVNVGRPNGVVTGWEMTADITLQDITRKVRFLVLPEKDVCVIGQNFFKEYSYQIDDFYVRLTKAPYQGDDPSKATKVATAASAASSASTASATAATSIVSPGPGIAARAASAANANALGNGANKQANALAGSTLTGPPGSAKLDRYTIPFEREQDTMLIDITVNGVPTKATFDTGCAPDGIVCHPAFASQAHMDHANYRGNRANRLVIGSIIRMDVPVYYAAGLRYPLVGPKIFNRPYTVDPINKLIKFDY